MESVIFDGKEYTKASVLAEKFRYTADYLGQLCRGKKVDARLVGRAWYINLDSLLAHREGRYKTIEIKNSPEIFERKAIHNYLSRIDVKPIIHRKTIRIVMNNKGAVSELPVKYEGDDQALIPRVQKDSISVNLPVTPADSERLRIHKSGPKLTNFRPEPLPEVSLSGTLSVVGIPEVTEEPVKTIEKKALNKDTTPTYKKPQSSPIQASAKVVFVRRRSSSVSVSVENPREQISTATIPHKPIISFRPNSVVTEPVVVDSTTGEWWSVLMVFFTAVLVSIVILTLTMDLTVTDGVAQTKFGFSLESFRLLFR